MWYIGVDLAKLVVKAILLIEDSGGEVIGLTSDGASTNRTMWSSLGVIRTTHTPIQMKLIISNYIDFSKEK